MAYWIRGMGEKCTQIELLSESGKGTLNFDPRNKKIKKLLLGWRKMVACGWYKAKKRGKEALLLLVAELVRKCRCSQPKREFICPGVPMHWSR
jgi:hypothetical protein